MTAIENAITASAPAPPRAAPPGYTPFGEVLLEGPIQVALAGTAPAVATASRHQ